MSTAEAMPAAILGGALTSALVGSGNVKAILATSSWTPNFTDTSWATVTGECSGGTYARTNVTVTAVGTIVDELGVTHLQLTASGVSIGRPSNTPAYVLLETAAHVPLAWMSWTDDEADPVAVVFAGGVAIDIRFSGAKAGLRLLELDDVTGSPADAQVVGFDAGAGTWGPVPNGGPVGDWVAQNGATDDYRVYAYLDRDRVYFADSIGVADIGSSNVIIDGPLDAQFRPDADHSFTCRAIYNRFAGDVLCDVLVNIEAATGIVTVGPAVGEGPLSGGVEVLTSGLSFRRTQPSGGG